MNIFIIVGTIIIFVFAFIVTIFQNYDDIKKIQVNKQDINIEEIAESMESDTENEYKTYYVAADGTSTDGTNINEPMSLKEAHKRTFYGNEKVLLKCGDTFYGTMKFTVKADDGTFFYIGSYGEGEKPIISGANILVNQEAWKLEKDSQLYKIDLSNTEYFQGLGNSYNEPYNIGFIEDEYGNIFGNRKKSKDLLENEFDFYCENQYLYIKSQQNPSIKLGKAKFVSRNNLVAVRSNTIIDGIIIQDTGAHGIVKASSEVHNVYIKNCIIQNIGGSVQKSETFTRYGNGIEFWNQAENTIVENCIIRNTYDTGYTIQGNTVTTGFYNNICRNNIFINCTYTHEIFCHNKETGETGEIKNFKYYNNISINEGRGWGYDVRPNQYPSAELTMWTISNKDGAEVNEYNNKSFNARRLYYITSYTIKNIKNELEKIIQSHNNIIYLNQDTNIFGDEKIDIFEKYSLEKESIYRLLSDTEIKKISNQGILSSNDYEKIKSYYENLEVEFKYEDLENEIVEKYNELENTYSENKDVVNKIEIVKQNIEQIRDNKPVIEQSKIEELITMNYEIADAVIENDCNNMVDLVNELDEIANLYNDLIYMNSDITSYSKESLSTKVTVTKKLLDNNSSNSKIDEAMSIYNLAMNHYEENTLLGYMQCDNLLDLSSKIIDMNIEDNVITLEYSTTEWTNQDVVVTLVSSGKIEMDTGNTYTFSKNGTFTFQYRENGEEKEVTAIVDWIDKELPKIVGFDDRADETSVVTVSVYDENLKYINVTKDGENIPFTNGDTLFDVGNYVITAEDMAGNIATKTVRIIDYEEGNYTYYVSLNGTGDGSSEDKPISLDRASTLEYKAGDKILFETGNQYDIDIDWNMVGSSENTIEISSYGEGEKPIINGSIGLVSNLKISNLYFKNSEKSSLITTQSYTENVTISNCIFDSVYNGITLNMQSNNIVINNCLFKNCQNTGIEMKNDEETLRINNIDINNNLFAGTFNDITISGKNENEIFDNVEIYNNYFANQSGDKGVINFGNIKDSDFDVIVYNNVFYNFEKCFSVTERNKENLKNNLVSDNNIFYVLEDGSLLNEVTDLDILRNDYKLEKKSELITMNADSYQLNLIARVINQSNSINEILSYIRETINLANSNKNVVYIDNQENVAVITSTDFNNIMVNMIGSADELEKKNSQEILIDDTVAQESLPLAGWKKIAITVVAILLVTGMFSGFKYGKFKKDTRKQLRNKKK